MPKKVFFPDLGTARSWHFVMKLGMARVCPSLVCVSLVARSWLCIWYHVEKGVQTPSSSWCGCHGLFHEAHGSIGSYSFSSIHLQTNGFATRLMSSVSLVMAPLAILIRSPPFEISSSNGFVKPMKLVQLMRALYSTMSHSTWKIISRDSDFEEF